MPDENVLSDHAEGNKPSDPALSHDVRGMLFRLRAVAGGPFRRLALDAAMVIEYLADASAKVKPLKWEQSTGPWAFRAGGFGEEYLVTKDYDTDDWDASIETYPRAIIGTFTDAAAAKDAVQERHESRVLSALTSPSSSP